MANIGALTTLTPQDQESLHASLEKWARDKAFVTDGSLPAIVVSYDRSTNLATVRPLIARVTMSDVQINRREIYDVPLLALGGGGFVINFPIAAGDLGWINACDRDLDSFKAQLSGAVKDVAPTTARVRTFADSWFVPDVFRKYTIMGDHSGDAVFQSLDGSSRVAVGNGKVTVGVGGSKIVIDSSQSKTTSPAILLDGPVTCTQGLTVAGATAANGGFTAASGQPCTLPTEATIAGKKVDGHDHAGVVKGGDKTDPF